MKSIILGTMLGLSATIVSAATDEGAVGGSFKKISDNRCGPGLRLRDETGTLYTQAAGKTAAANTHDFYGQGGAEQTQTEDWLQMVNDFPGIDAACQRFDKTLQKIDADLVAPASRTNQYVSHPHSWKRQVAKKLHDAGCAISRHDDNFEQYIESFNYPFQQRLRMQKAKLAADEYELKIQTLQDEWKSARALLVSDMNDHGDNMLNKLKESERAANRGEYEAATDVVLGEHSDSAVAELEKVTDTIQKRGEAFEALAHSLKRDSLRWAKLNQISNEQERLDIMSEVVKLNGFDLLVTCLVNFQKEASLAV